MELRLKLMSETPTSTASAMWHGDKFICFIIEDGFHPQKIAGITRIPGGRYKLVKKTDGEFLMKYKAKFGHQYIIEISGVPDFNAILFHIGNFPVDTRGCQLPCDQVAFNHKENFFWGTASEVAYKRFYTYMQKYMDGDCWLSVER